MVFENVCRTEAPFPLQIDQYVCPCFGSGSYKCYSLGVLWLLLNFLLKCCNKECSYHHAYFEENGRSQPIVSVRGSFSMA